jgi:homoserine kinase
VKRNALNAGALAVTISGAGPSMISFMREGRQNPEKICKAMEEGFMSANVKCRTLHCKTGKGAMIEGKLT